MRRDGLDLGCLLRGCLLDLIGISDLLLFVLGGSGLRVSLLVGRGFGSGALSDFEGT